MGSSGRQLLTIHPSRIAVAGDSAGGNLAAATALLARDRGAPALAAQVLLYPVLDPKCDSPSYNEFAEEHFNTAAAMHWYWENYLGSGRDPDRGSFPAEYAAPSCADDLIGLAPAALVLAGLGPTARRRRALRATSGRPGGAGDTP